MKIKTVGFIGLGLIGGSIAKAILEYDSTVKIYAHTYHKETLIDAYNEGVILNNDFLPLEEFGSFDLIFLCSPVKINIDYVRKLKPFLQKNCILTDVGSVKGDIHKEIQSLGLSSQFIGGHPMTGSEKIGYSHSASLLMENAYYILTSDENTNMDLISEFADFVKELKSIPITMSYQTHDFATAAISHFPHVMSAALVNLVKENETQDSILKTIAAGGFKDITRISSSSPIMWQNICVENKDEILKLISLYTKQLDSFKNAISTSDETALMELFTSAKDYRDSLPMRKTGVLPVSFELYCDLKDETGMIAKVATLLAAENINLKNIGIINSREFIQGALHIEVESFESLEKTKTILKQNGYFIHETY